MAKKFELSELFKRLDSVGIEYEEVQEGDKFIIIIIFPRTKIRCKYFVETNQLQFINDLSEKQEMDILDSLSKDMLQLIEALT